MGMGTNIPRQNELPICIDWCGVWEPFDELSGKSDFPNYPIYYIDCMILKDIIGISPVDDVCVRD
jgi:hypothetical protein